MRLRLALTAGIICAAFALGAFFYFGQNREVEARAGRIASEKAIFATAEQRKTTYAEVQSSASRCYSLPPVAGVTNDTIWKEKSALEAINIQQCVQQALYGGNYEELWNRQRIIEWMELPTEIALAFLAGFLTIYLFAIAVHLVRDRWWPWVQGK